MLRGAIRLQWHVTEDIVNMCGVSSCVEPDRGERNQVLKWIAKECFSAVHFVAHKTLKLNPLVRKRVNAKAVGYGFVSADHLNDPSLDDALVVELQNAGVEVGTYTIDFDAYADYVARAAYPDDYPAHSRVAFDEKSLEHFVSADVLNFQSDDVLIDIAAGNSPFTEIVQRLWSPSAVYRQDMNYSEGIHGHQIGGNAGALPLGDRSVSKVTLHCSLEHFEGSSDMELFGEMGRVLRPGGRVCILPFYIAHEHTIHTDPIRYFFTKDLKFDEGARIRHCSWRQRHTRHYDVEQLKRRILSQLRGMKLKVLRVTNYKEAHPGCYLRFIALIEKPQVDVMQKESAEA